MSVSIEDVEHIAHLARLGLRDDEKQKLRGDLESILGYVEKLRSLDTTGVEASASVASLRPAMRDDIVTNGDRAEDMVRGAPDREENFLRVPKIIE